MRFMVISMEHNWIHKAVYGWFRVRPRLTSPCRSSKGHPTVMLLHNLTISSVARSFPSIPLTWSRQAPPIQAVAWAPSFPRTFHPLPLVTCRSFSQADLGSSLSISC